MNKAIIVYGSEQGHTTAMAELIRNRLEDSGIETTLKNVTAAHSQDLLDYPLIFLGSSTWGNGDLQADFLDFERDMDDLNLRGHFVAAFGSGSSRYPLFCEAVRILEAKLISLGGKRIIPSLSVDILENNQDEATAEWADKLIEEIGKIRE